MTIRVYFLILATFLVFRLPLWEGVAVFVGYYICERVDQWLERRRKDRIFDEETMLWEEDPEDPTHETFGNLSRIKLENHEQRIVTRIAEFIRRLE
jgi:hypothetical protein